VRNRRGSKREAGEGKGRGWDVGKKNFEESF